MNQEQFKKNLTLNVVQQKLKSIQEEVNTLKEILSELK